jgi:hypothetical protein
VAGELRARGIRLVLASVEPDVREELDRYGISEAVGEASYYDTIIEAIAAFGGTGESQ